MRISKLIIASLAVLVIFATTRADDESTRIKGASFKAGDPVLIEKELASSKINDSPSEWSKNVSTITTLARKREQKSAPSKISETNNFTTITNRKMGQGENQNGQNTTTRDLDFASSVGMLRKISEERGETKRQGKEDDAEEEEEEERGVGENNDEDLGEAMPEAQELRAPRPGSHGRPLYRLNASRRPPNSNRRRVFPVEAPLRSSKRPNRKPQEVKDLRTMPPTENDCTFFTKNLCLETINYPHEAIMRSIRGNKEMVSALLSDYNPQNGNDDLPKALPLENHFDNRYESKYENNEIKRRSDYPSPYENVEEGFTCPSQVMYARPQLARAVSGVWKYIINTGEHTQTLRLEKCSKPKAACSFISENYRSSCVQVYNYHRLLTWDSSLGLHMDIFKVPSCCSCHVHGYAELYPPIQKDPQSPTEERFPGADFATEQIEDDTFKRPSSYLTKIRPSSLDNNYVSSGGGGGSKPILDAGSSHRPSYTLPGRTRQKKPPSSSGISKPFDKLPQQHAPNTRAPGYKGPIMKGINRPIRTNRPYRRQSTAEIEETSTSVNKWFNQPYDQDTEASSKLHNGGFDEEYQEPNRRVNYNYHPIIDFFKPEASMLQAQEPLSTQRSASALDSSENSWKPMISP